METSLSGSTTPAFASLETFLVEWKLALPPLLERRAGRLETFLVEWKRFPPFPLEPALEP